MNIALRSLVSQSQRYCRKGSVAFVSSQPHNGSLSKSVENFNKHGPTKATNSNVCSS